MRTHPARTSVRRALAALALLTAVPGCGGPPSAPVATTLTPGKGEAATGAHGAFSVVFAGPRGEVADRAEPAVTVLFNRAMRDPESADTVGLPPVRLEVEGGAPVTGSFRWVGTHGLLFTPDHPLPGSTRFHVAVPAGTRSLDGEAITAEYAFDFSTAWPKVVATEPSDGARDVRPEATFRVTFNQPMALDVVEQRARFFLPGKAGEPPLVVVAKATRAKSGKNKEDAIVLTPAAKLPRDSVVELVLDAGLHGEGPLAATASKTLHFRTYGPLVLASVTCPRTTGPRCEAHRDFTVVLSNAVDPAEFKAHLKAPDLKLVPPPKVASATRKPPPPSTTLLVAADPDFGQRYHLTLTKGLRDVFGQRLEQDLSFDVDTEAPWLAAGKAVDARTAAARGNGENDGHDGDAHYEPSVDQAVPHRARLDYRVDLGIAGHVVEALATTGQKAHRVPVGAVNIPTYGVFEQRFGEEDALAWLLHASGQGPGGLPFRWTWVSPNAPENVWAVRDLDLDRLLGGPAGRGAALLAVGLPGSSDQTSLVTVTDLALSAEVSRFGSLVWVTRLSSGEPVRGASVGVRGVEKGELFATTTDASGLASFPAGDWIDGKRAKHSDVRGEPYFFVRAGEDWTYTKVAQARANYGSGIDLDVKAAADWAGMIYADRGVYRPGETMKLAGVFRKVDAGGVTIVEGQSARVLLEDSQGEKIFDGRAKLGAFGELALDVPLSKTSHLGNATIKVELGRKETQSFSQDVLLAAYKASEFKVAVDAAKPAYVRGDSGSFDVHAAYLFGAPMGGVHYQTAILRHAVSFAPAHSEGFVTNDDLYALDHPETSPSAESLADPAGELDALGHAGVVVPFAFARMRGPEEVVVEAEITDLSHETVAQRTSVRVHPAAFYLGLGASASRFVAVGAEVPVTVVAFEPEGRHVAGVAAKVELLERTWTSATLDEAADVPRRESRVHDEVVARCDVTTTEAAASCKVRVARPGYYLVRAQAKDARGNPTGATSSLYCLSDRSDAVVSWAPPGPSRRLKLETDKKLYEAGDVARVLIQNPFKKAEALVTVERGGVLDQQVVALEGPMPIVSVKVKPEYFPNAFVSVRLVRGRVAEAPAAGADLGAPDFRLGLVRIAVDPATHRLTPTITTDHKQYAPGDEVVADVLVKGNDGKPARGEVTFYAVDEGVLMLTAYETPDPLPAFSADRKLAVFAVESREDLAHLLPLKNGEHIRPLGYDYLNPPGGDKGSDGGGGGEDGPRIDFKTTAFFEAGKVTDAEGRVRYRFKLPDNLTTFRLMAIVAGADDRFGGGDTTVLTSKHLMARPVLPRIVRVGDKLEAGVLVSSKDLPATTARVTVTAKGIDLAGAHTRDVLVPSGGSVEVRFPFVATAAGQATFDFRAEGGGAQDEVRVTRPIDLPLAIETVSTYGETTGPVAVALGDLSKQRPDEGGLDVHLASTALVGLGSSFDALVEYPYGCTEQLTSRILPLLVLPDLARAVGARLPARIPDAVDAAIGDLLDHQDSGGGFTYWGEGGGNPEPWLSAYAMLAVEGAAQKGMFVPKDARDRGIAYLRQVLDQTVPAEDDEPTPSEPAADDAPPAVSSTERSPKEKHARAYAEMAFVADTLASLGQVDPGTLNRLFESRAHRPLFSQALLLHAMAVAHLPVSQLDTVANEIVARLRVDANDAYADEVTSAFDDFLDSPTRTSALVLRALVAARPEAPLASRLAHGLLARRQGGGWRSTQENVWALLALDDYRKAQENAVPSFDARVFLGRTALGEAHFHGGSSIDQAFTVDMPRVFPESGQPLTFDVVGTGKLYYAANLRTASPLLPTHPRDAGLYVQKIVRAITPAQLAAAQKVLPQRGDTQAAAGNLVLIDLILETAEPHEQVVIDDPLPAGLEGIDLALETSTQSLRVADDGPHRGDPRAYGAAFRTPSSSHREQHDDRVLTFLPHIEPGLYHFRYLARATTPGDFVVPPTRASCMYSPEVWGASAASRFVVAGSASTPGVNGPVAKAP